MPEHLLDCAQIGASLQQMSSEAVPERMGMDLTANPSPLGSPSHEFPDSHPREAPTSVVEEHHVRRAPQQERTHIPTVALYPPACNPADGYQTLLCSLPADAHELMLQEEIAQPQLAQLRHTEPTSIEHLQNGSVSDSPRCADIWLLQEPLDFLDAENFGQWTLTAGEHEQFGGVCRRLPHKSEKPIERSQSRHILRL
jgi:hypothetical protein